METRPVVARRPCNQSTAVHGHRRQPEVPDQFSRISRHRFVSRPTRDSLIGPKRGRRFLNMFGYASVFTTYAIEGGARSTMTVDFSKTYLVWKKTTWHSIGWPAPRINLSRPMRSIYRPSRYGDLVSTWRCSMRQQFPRARILNSSG